MERFVSALTSVLPPVIIFCGAYFTLYLRGFFVFHPIKTLRLMLRGGKNPLRELSVSLAGALGVGNIVGVSVAISLGGAGAVFWMWASALLSMILKYCEIVLALKYRQSGKNGNIGGPMYYMQNGVGGKTGKILAVIFSSLGLVCAGTLGNAVQMNAAAVSVSEALGVPRAVTGLIMCVLCALVIFGGFSGISKFTSVAVPVMSAVYLFFSVRAIAVCGEGLIPALSEIIASAFTPDSASGGILGYVLSSAVRQGVSKGAFSHEAGSGTAPMAHAQSENASPAAQGTLGIFEVFFDTVIMCTVTALVILTSGEPISDGGVSGVISAFAVSCGGIAKYMIAVSVAIFAFSTVICWSYYGRCCVEYFTKSKTAVKVYMGVYCASVMLGAIISESSVWMISDVSVACMTVVNLCAVVMLRREIKKETDAVFGKTVSVRKAKAARGISPQSGSYSQKSPMGHT